MLETQIAEDVKKFEGQIADIRDRQSVLRQELEKLDGEVLRIEPICSYAKSLLTGQSVAGQSDEGLSMTPGAIAARKKRAKLRDEAKQVPNG